MPAQRAARVRVGPPGTVMARRPSRVCLMPGSAQWQTSRTRLACLAVAEATPQVSSLQLEVCFEAPTQLVPPTVIQTTGRIIASASTLFVDRRACSLILLASGQGDHERDRATYRSAIWCMALNQRAGTGDVGDIHGDINKAMSCLELASVAEFPNGIPVWTGGDAIVVQLGDIFDRGDAEIATLMLLRQLGRQAEAEGGAIHILNGNHESLNVCGDFRYVTRGAFLESAMIMGLPDEDMFDMEKLIRARMSLFCPGQPVALELSKNPTVLVVNDTVFAHGSLLPMHVHHGIERINAEVAAWMRRDQLPSGGHAPPPFIAMGSIDGVMWNRTFGKEKMQPFLRVQLQRQLEQVLRPLNCKRQVVGHTPQMQGANSDCNGQIWRLDVGMSRNMLDAKPCVLELTEDIYGATRCELLS